MAYDPSRASHVVKEPKAQSDITLDALLDEFEVSDPAVRERVLRLAGVESSGNLNATGPRVNGGMHNGTRARGALQIMPATAKAYPQYDLNDPADASRAGLHYFLDNLNQFGGDLDAATIAHHAGPGTAKKWLREGRAGTIDRATGLSTDDYLLKVTGGKRAKPADKWWEGDPVAPAEAAGNWWESDPVEPAEEPGLVSRGLSAIGDLRKSLQQQTNDYEAQQPQQQRAQSTPQDRATPPNPLDAASLGGMAAGMGPVNVRTALKAEQGADPFLTADSELLNAPGAFDSLKAEQNRREMDAFKGSYLEGYRKEGEQSRRLEGDDARQFAQQQYDKDFAKGYPSVKPAEASWKDTFNIGATQAGRGMTRGFYAALESVGDMVGATDLAKYAAEDRAQQEEAIAGRLKSSLGKVPEDGFKSIVGDAIPTIISQGAPIAAAALATVATRNPEVGKAMVSATVLAPMGIQSYGNAYADGKAQGLALEDRVTYGVGTALAEVLPERISLGYIMDLLTKPLKAGGKKAAEQSVVNELARRFLQMQATEMTTEQITTVSDFLLDRYYTNPDLSLKDLQEQVVRTALVTPIATTALGAAGAAGSMAGAAISGRPRDLTAGMNPDQAMIDALARQSLDPSNAQMVEVMPPSPVQHPEGFEYAQETADVAPPLDATSYQGPGADPAGGAGNTPSGPVNLGRVDQPTGAPARSGEPGVSVGEAERQQVAGVVEQTIAQKEAEAAATGDPIELLVTRAEGAAMRRAVTPQPANGIDIDQDALLADVEAMFTEGGNLMVQGDNAREAVKRIDPKALASALPRGDGALLVPKRFAGPVMDALQGAKQRVSVAFGGDGMMQAPDVAQFRATVPTQEEVQDVPKAQSLATQAQEAGGQEGAAAFDANGLAPGTAAYEAAFQEWVENKDAARKKNESTSRREESAAAIEKRNRWRSSVRSWFEASKDGDEIVDKGTGQAYRVFERTRKDGTPVKTLIAVDEQGSPLPEGRGATGISKIGNRIDGLNDNSLDQDTGSANLETPGQMLSANLGQLLESGEAVFSLTQTPTTPASDQRSEPAQPSSTEEDANAEAEQAQETRGQEGEASSQRFVGLAAYNITNADPLKADDAPLSLDDAAFELDVLQDRADRGRLTPEAFAQSGIAQRLDTAQMMTINDSIRAGDFSFIGALKSRIEQAQQPTQAPTARGQEGEAAADGRVTRDRPMNDGATVTDAEGNQYRVHYQRNDLVIAHPIVNGKPQVSADTTVRFWTNQDVAPSGENDRTDPIYPVVQPVEARSSIEGEPASWVIRNKETGEAVMETFDRAKVDALNTKKYEAVPILQHLQEVNRGIKSTQAPTAPEQSSPAPAQTQAADKPKRKPPARKPDPVTVDRAQRNAEDLRAMAQDAGWAEKGGKLIRDAEGNVSRTKWIPRAQWFLSGMESRPDVLAQHIEAAARGEWIPVKSARTIEGMVEWLDAQRGQATLDEDASMYDFEASFGDVLDVPDAREVAEFFDDAFGDFAEQSEADAMRAMGFTEEEIANAGGQTQAGAGSAEATDARGTAEAGERTGEAGTAQEEAGQGQQEGLTTAPVYQQTFDQWLEQKWSASRYKDAYIENADGDVQQAKYAAVSGGGKSETAARNAYWSELIRSPRDADVSSEMYDGLTDAQKHDASRHFFKMDDVVRDRLMQQAERSNAESERIERDVIGPMKAELDRLQAMNERTKSGTDAWNRRAKEAGQLEYQIAQLRAGRMTVAELPEKWRNDRKAAKEDRAKPMLQSNGKPFPSEKLAAESARQRKLDMVPVEVDGGWGLAQKSAEPLALDTYTNADIAQREAEQTAQAEADARAEREAAAKQRQAEERAEVRRRSEAAADTFELGMDPMENLTGQGDIFSQPAPQTAPQEDGDWLMTLFGEDTGNAKEQMAQIGRDEARKAKTQAERIKALRGAMDSVRKDLQAQYDDWAGRVYKKNKNMVELQGDGPSSQAAISVGSINENRRRRAMEALNDSLQAVGRLEKQIAADQGVKDMLRTLDRIMDRAKQLHESGNFTFLKSQDAAFEYILLDDALKMRPANGGSLTSNEISRAMLAFMKRDFADAGSGATESERFGAAAEPDRKAMPSGLSFPSERIVTNVQAAFEPLEVQASSIGTSGGYVNFGSQYPDGRYYIESAGKSIGFIDGKWGDVTPRGLQPKGEYDTGSLQAETIRVLQSQGARLAKDAAAQQGGLRFSRAGQPLESVKAAWRKAGIDFALQERGDVVTVSKIVVPEGAREAGAGTRAMEQLVAWADANGKHLALTPSADFGGNAKRLTAFYKRFGFKENKGKSRVLSVSESMIRENPNGKPLYSFAGQNAETADTMALDTAQRRIAAGEDAEAVRQETGWFKGAEMLSAPAPANAPKRFTRSALVQSISTRFPSLTRAVESALRRGDEGKPGGVVVVERAEDLAGTFASKTGRTLEEAQKSLQASIRAWHGSPHRFDRFSTQNIGTGEGAQAYGYGLYFADSRGVAEHYKSKLAKAELFINGERSVLDYNDPAGNMARQEVLDAANAGIKDAVGYARLQNYVYPGVLERLQYWHENGIAEVRKGALYKVSIAPDEDTFLLWDKPLSEQPKKVRDALRKLDWMDESVFEQYTGQQMYEGQVRDATMFEGRDKGNARREASGALLKAGIRGIKYLDGQSRDGKGDSFNYVVFDDADVEIVDVQFSQNGDIQGFFDSRSGLTFLVAPNLTERTAPAVLLHEATHGKQRAEIDRKAMELIETRQARSKPLRDFLFRVEQRMDAAGESGNASEAAAYIVEEAVVAGRQAGFSAVDGKLMNWIDLKFGRRVSDIVRDFVAMIRAWAMRAGVELNPTVDDLVAIAKLNVRDMARGDVTGGERAQESRASPIQDYEQSRIEGATVSVSLTPESAAEVRIERKISAASNPADKARLQGYYDFLRGRQSAAKEKGPRLEVSYQQGWNKGKNLRENILKGRPWYETEKYRDGSVWKWEMYREGLYVASGEAKSEKSADQAIEDAKISAMESRDDFAKIRASRASQTASKAFRDWFGDSKVVDENGQPLVVYHGTQADFSVFDAGRLGETTSAKSARMGFFFASNPAIASTYAFLDRGKVRRGNELKSLIKEEIDIGLILRRKDKAKALDASHDKERLREDLRARLKEITERSAEIRKEQEVADKNDAAEWAALAGKSDRDQKFLAERIDGGVVYPVYLAIQNPLYHEFSGGTYRDESYSSLVERALDGGHDGLVLRNTKDSATGHAHSSPVTDIYVAFRPEQIKSAVGNNGNFDPTDRRINFSRAGQAAMSAPAAAAQPAQAGPRAAQAQAKPPEETRFQAFQRKAQDKLNRFTVIKEWLAAQGVTLSEQADVYKAEERMHSRFANKAEDFREKTVKPLVEKIQRAGYSMDDVAQYLHAQHAEERNIQVASINKQMPDGGSGMKTADANAILAAAPAELKRLANEFRAITERTKQILLDSGIISQDMADAWDAAYQHYVPLKGGPEQGGKGAGKGLKANYKGKRALGHLMREEGEWIVENILADHERALMLAEKNRVGQSLLKMAIEVGRDDLLTVGKPEKRGVLKNNTAYEVLFKGKVIGAFQSLEAARTFRATAPAAMKGASPSEFGIRKVSDPTVAYMASPMLADNEVNVYVKGQAIRVQINDELLARAYGNMGTEALGAILRVGATINGYFSKIYTGYNPEFILTNIVRDFTTGVANVTGEEGAMMALRAAKDYPASFADLFRYATTGNASQWIRMYREDGGNTGAAYLSDLERLGDEISTEYAAYKGVLANLKAGDVKSAARAAGRKAFDKTLVWVERINQAGENAMRLSIYKAMIESGKSRAEAASLAKNATVNFNRNGEVGRQMNALWLFYNAGVQGTAAIAHANLKGRHKWQARAVSAGILGLGYTMAVALGAGDDEDDYDKLSDYTKARNVVIKTGDGWLKIPVPYGYGFFWNMGRAIADAERKGEWGKAPWHVASSFIEEFTPFGAAFAGDDLTLEQVTLGALPTLAQIPASVGMNRTTMGGPMYPESAFDKYQPDNEKMWRATKGTIPDMIAQALDQGGIEVSPETIKYLTRTFTGGAGQFVTSIGDAAWLTANGASLEVKEQPFVRKFYTETDVREARSAYHAAVAEAEKAVREGKSILKMGDHAAYGAYRAENQEFYALDRMAKARAAAIKARRNYADAIRADKSLSVKEKRDKLKAAEAQEQVIYDRYLEVFKSRTRQ